MKLLSGPEEDRVFCARVAHDSDESLSNRQGTHVIIFLIYVNIIHMCQFFFSLSLSLCRCCRLQVACSNPAKAPGLLRRLPRSRPRRTLGWRLLWLAVAGCGSIPALFFSRKTAASDFTCFEIRNKPGPASHPKRIPGA